MLEYPCLIKIIKSFCVIAHFCVGAAEISNCVCDSVLCALFQGCCNINSEVFLSLPGILGTSGVIEMVRLEEDPLVQEKLQSSAGSTDDLQQQLKL